MSMTKRRSEPQAPPAAPRVHRVIRCAFYVFIISLPFEYPNRSFPVETTTITCALFLLAVLYQPRVCFRRFPGAAAWFVGFLYAFLVSFVVNGGQYEDEVQKFFLLMLQLLMLLWAGYNVLRDEEVFSKAPVMLVVACTVRAVLQMLNIGTSHVAEWVGGERVSMLGQNSNQSAMMMAAGLIALIGLGYAGSAPWRRLRLLIWPAAALIGLAIIQNGSRGGVIALAMGVMTFTLGGSGMWSRIRSASVVVLALGLLIWASYNSEAMRNRFQQTASTGYMAGRERLYPELVHMFVERPILGFAPIANKYVLGGRVPQQHVPRRDAHNLFLEVMTATGIVGLIPFMLGLWLPWRAAWRARRGPPGILPLALLVNVLMANMSGNWLAAPLLWFIMAYALASDRAQKPAPARGPVLRRPAPAPVSWSASQPEAAPVGTRHSARPVALLPGGAEPAKAPRGDDEGTGPC